MQRHTRTEEAHLGWPVNLTCAITWNIPQTYSRVLGSLAQGSAFSNKLYRWIQSLRLAEGRG